MIRIEAEEDGVGWPTNCGEGTHPTFRSEHESRSARKEGDDAAIIEPVQAPKLTRSREGWMLTATNEKRNHIGHYLQGEPTHHDENW
jgi:hypothetical protein